MVPNLLTTPDCRRRRPGPPAGLGRSGTVRRAVQPLWYDEATGKLFCLSGALRAQNVNFDVERFDDRLAAAVMASLSSSVDNCSRWTLSVRGAAGDESDGHAR